jgi:xanthine dehydrogenase accessory factor
VSTAGRSDSFQPITALQWIFGELSTAPKQIKESAVRELLDDLDRWRTQGKRVAIARVVDIEGSGPREPGAAMAVSEDGVVAGSVSGGCVEGAVVEAALESLRTGERRVHTFGFSDTDAFAVGLTCGGIIHLFVEPLDW